MMAAVIEELNLQSLVQVVLASWLSSDCAVSPPSFLINFLYLLLLLNFLGPTLKLSSTVHASCDHRRVVRNCLI